MSLLVARGPDWVNVNTGMNRTEMGDHTIKKKKKSKNGESTHPHLPRTASSGGAGGGGGRLFLEGQHPISTEGGRSRSPPFRHQRPNDRCRRASPADATASEMLGKELPEPLNVARPPIILSLQRGRRSSTRARSGQRHLCQ